MTQPAVNSEEVTALFAERQRYETWLSTLEAKRASTPSHIYQRVHADYAARLQRVNDQLASHHAALRELEGSLAARLTALEADEIRCRDEAAEVELRALVGELTAEQQREVAERTRASLTALGEERAKVVEELSRLRAILEAASPSEAAPDAPTEAPAAAQESAAVQPAAEAPAAEPEASRTQEAGGAVATTADGATTSGEPVGPAADDWQLAFEQTPEPRATPRSTPSVPTPSTPAHSAPAAPEPGPFDDLEFLKSMVEPRSSAPAGPQESLARATGIDHGTEAPAEQPKTLKCQECSTLNYPTEWYCERCGAELAAL